MAITHIGPAAKVCITDVVASLTERRIPPDDAGKALHAIDPEGIESVKALSPAIESYQRAFEAAIATGGTPPKSIDSLLLADQAAVDALPSLGRVAIPCLVRVVQWAPVGSLDDRLVRMGSSSARYFIDNYPPVRALRSLARIGVPALPALIDALSSKDGAYVRACAASELAEMRSEAMLAIPALRRALHDQGEDVASSSQYALGAIGTLDAGRVAAYLADVDPRIRVLAAQTLGAMGKEAAPAEAPLRKALGDPDPSVREYAQAALNAMR